MPTYRTNGAWGAGIGVNLTPAQVDNNFYELRTDLDDVIANPPTADGLDSVTQSGFYLTFHTTLGNELGPIAIPVVYPKWRGDWSPFTIYAAADEFRDAATGIYVVLQDHTSAATFDPDEAGGSPLAPYYLLILAATSLPADTSLDELNDVTITSVADGDLIAWDDGLSQWTNRTPGDVLTLLAPTLDDLTDVIAPSPVVGQILRYLGGSPDKGWQPDTLSLDDLDDVSVAAPSDGYLLTYQAGSPTGWIAAAPPVLPTELDDLTDVIAPSPSDGDLLQFDGADWINAAGMSVSGLDDAFLPLVGSDLFEVSQSSGSPPGSPPVGYESRKATLANILAAGGFTLGSTSIALGGTTTTVAGLTLTAPNIGAATGTSLALTAGRLTTAGTVAAAQNSYVNFGGTFSSSVTSTQYILNFNPTISPTGASLGTANGAAFLATISGSVNISEYNGAYSQYTIAAGYSGTQLTAAAGFVAFYGTNSSSVDPPAQYDGFKARGAGATGATGTYNNAGFRSDALTAAAAGATVNNMGLIVTVPSGNATSGTNNNYGLRITGNGAAGGAGGTVNNFAIFSSSTAPVQIGGVLQLLGATASFPMLKRNATVLEARLADDSAYAPIAGAALRQYGGENGQFARIISVTELTTIAAAATTDTAIQIPANSIVIAVSVRVTVAIPTAATFDYGIAGTTNRYGAAVAVAANTTSPGTIDALRYYAAAISIRFTPSLTPAANTGRVRVTIHYIDVTPPTS